ncbi:MAG: RND family transporter [Candidatus Aegiribacteria sp.]|nr:RND family transporter [Candidatus Aegiribacteria sp.]
MKWFTESVIRFRIPIIVSVALITVFMAIGLSKVVINSDMVSYLDPENSTIQLFNHISERYGGNNIIMVAVEGEDIFTNEALTVIRDITESCHTVSGVMSVTSLTDILDMRDTEFGLEIKRLINKNDIPTDNLELEALREYTLGKEMYTGKIISQDGRITLITIRTHPDADDAELVTEIRSNVERLRDGYSVYYGGIPVQIQESGNLLTEDIFRLIPIVILVVILVLFLGFRNFRAVILPLSVVLISTIWTIGAMGWFGVELSMVSNITPIVLVAVGSAYGIHFMARYREDANKDISSIEVTKIALKDVGIPVLLTGVTTLIGFLSLSIGGSLLTAIADFGLFTAIGVAAATLLSVTLIPAICSLLPVHVSASRTGKRIVPRSWLGKFEAKLILRRRLPILLISGVLTIICLILIPELDTEVNILEYFPEDSEIRTTADLLKDRFGSAVPFQVIINGDIKDPLVLKQMLKVEKYLQSHPDVESTQSLADLIAELNYIITGRWAIPETRDQVTNLLFLLEGEDILSRLVNDDYNEALIHAQLSSLNTGAIVSASEQTDSYLESDLNTKFTKVEYDRLSINEQEIVRDYQLKEVAENIYNDAANREQLTEISHPDLVNQLREITSMPAPDLSAEYLSMLQERFREYLLWEAPIIIDSDSLIDLIVFSLTETVEHVDSRPPDFRAAVSAAIPEIYYEDNPENLDIVAGRFGEFVSEAETRSQIDHWLTELLGTLPTDLSQNERFRKDVRGNLWAMSENLVGIPSDLFESVPGDSVNFQAVLSGFLPVFTTLNGTLIHSQITSLGVAFMLIFLLMMYRFRSPLMGLIIALPLVFTVIINFGVMSFAGVSLDIATIMVGSISIGIGIDYAIHASSRFQEEFRKQGDEEAAMKTMISTTGKSIFVNAMTVGLGFLVLMWSNILPIRRFGWLIALTMLVSMVASLTLLPSLVLVCRKHLRLNNRKHTSSQIPEDQTSIKENPVSENQNVNK